MILGILIGFAFAVLLFTVLSRTNKTFRKLQHESVRLQRITVENGERTAYALECLVEVAKNLGMIDV